MLFHVACVLFLLLLGPTSDRICTAAAAVGAIKTLYEFQDTPYTDLENVGSRSNGHLILNAITAPKVYTLNPAASRPSPSLLYDFPGATSVLGIAQPSQDLFAVVVGNYSTATFQGIPGSFSIWTLDLTKDVVAVKQVSSIPQAHALNGMATLSGSSTKVFVADSSLGAVFSVDIESGDNRQVMQNEAFEPTSTFPLGINGIHSSGNTLYFTNSAAGTFGSIPIASDGTAAGSVETIARAPSGETYDDFALDSRRHAFIATHPNSVLEVASSGTQSSVAQDSQFNNPTSLSTFAPLLRMFNQAQELKV